MLVARYHVAVNIHQPIKRDKFRAYRERKREAGLREVRMWVPDVEAPGFWEQSELAAAILRAAPSEEETMVFLDALHASDPDLWD